MAKIQTKVLYICPTSTVGGAETFIMNSYTGHDKSQFELHYLLFKKGPLYNWLSERGANVHTLAKPPRLSRPMSWFVYKKELRHLCAHLKPHLIHSTMAYAAIFTAFAHTHIKHIWFQHGPATSWLDTLAGLTPHEGLIVNSDFTLSEQLKRERRALRLKNKVQPRKVLTLRLGTSALSKEVSFESKQNAKIKLFESQKCLNESSHEKILISMLTRFQSWKGIHLLLEVLKTKAFEAYLEKTEFIIWGAHTKGDYLEQIKKLCTGLPVHLPGVTHNKEQALLATDILVNASIQSEPFGLSLIEGLSAGCAVVAPLSGGPKDMFTKEQGAHFRPNCSEDLAFQLAQLCSDHNRLQSMQMKAYKLFQTHYTTQQMTKNLEAYYQEFFVSQDK